MRECLNCRSSTRNPRFCSKSCSTTYNNNNHIGARRKPEGACRGCGEPLSTRKIWCARCLGTPGGSQTRSSALEGPSLNSSTEVYLCKCGKNISKLASFCHPCAAKISADTMRTSRILSWLSGEWDGTQRNNPELSNTIRIYLLEKYQSCQRCSFSTTHPDDNKPILEVNHINGNGYDHRPENLEILCPNCHALTSSYRGRNIGKGRKVYYLRKTR